MKANGIDYVILGNSIQHFRQKTSISSLEAAQALDLTVEKYIQIERGESKPSLELVLSICCLLHISPDALLLECMNDYARKHSMKSRPPAKPVA